MMFFRHCLRCMPIMPKLKQLFFFSARAAADQLPPALAPLAIEGPEDGAFGLETCVSNGLCGACVSIGVSYFFVRKYMDILNAKPKFREVKKKLFMEHFVKTGCDKNLHTLYSAVTGDNFSGESVLEITLNYEEKSRRAMEDFCARLKNLFCIGLIALMGYTALKDCDDEEKLLQDWGEKMKEVQVKMNAVIEDCITSFSKQAELDSRRLVRDHSDLSNQQLADAILEKLKKKYDWVCWSVRIFSSPSGLFSNKNNIQCPTGKNRFQVTATDEKLNIMVSYSASPEPLNKAHIQQLIQSQKKLTVVGTAELLFEQLPGACAVHTVKTCKDLACVWSFAEELHYWEEHKNFYVCVHCN